MREILCPNRSTGLVLGTGKATLNDRCCTLIPRVELFPIHFRDELVEFSWCEIKP